MERQIAAGGTRGSLEMTLSHVGRISDPHLLHDRDLFSGQIEIPDLSGLLMALIYRNFTFQFLDKPW